MDTIFKAAYLSLVLVFYALHIALGSMVAWLLLSTEYDDTELWEDQY